MRKPALGKGLDAILGGRAGLPAGSGEAEAVEGSPSGRPLLVDIDRISAGRGQPRRRFDDSALDELADSIRTSGILQPLLVAEAGANRFELIAGERRLRAAARAGLDRVPVIVKSEVHAHELVELALIENVQREDLTAIEQARGYQRLVEEHGYTQEQVAKRVGKSRAAVANSLRILKLPAEVRNLVESGELSEGHARALLALPTAAQQIRVAARAARRGLSVRQTEDLVRRLEAGNREDRTATKPRVRLEEASALKSVEQSVARALGTKVRLHGTAAKGRIEIEYYSREQLDSLIESLTG